MAHDRYALAVVVALVVVFALLPAKWDPAMWLKAFNERHKRRDDGCPTPATCQLDGCHGFCSKKIHGPY
jgi:hypothetical protein